MSQENSEQAATALSAKDCVPVLMPREIWNRFLKLPFRKRHPVIFWGILIPLIILALFLLFSYVFEDDDSMPQEDGLALVRINGAIFDPAPTLAWLRKIEQASNIKGILVRIDSPGGGAAASQEIYAALARIGKKIPIVASMGSMAASGGLMVAMAAKRIYANPSTVTGSIGVRMDIPQLQDLMAKIGVGQETLVTAPYKDAASYTHPLSPQAREYLDAVLMNMHDQFVEIVAKGRNMPLEQAKNLASGKIFTGQQAQQLGLVDEMGGQYEAHAWLASQTDINMKKKLVTPREKRRDLFRMVLTEFSDFFSSSLENLEEVMGKARQPAFLYQF